MLKYNNRKIKAKIHLVSKVCPSKPVEEKEKAKRRKRRKQRKKKEEEKPKIRYVVVLESSVLDS